MTNSPGENEAKVDVVVIDDSLRFALHLWRRFGEVLAVGFGDQVALRTAAEPRRSTWFGSWRDKVWQPEPLMSTSGEVAFWWIDAVPGDQLDAELDKVFAKRRAPGLVVVIDAHAEPRKGAEKDAERYEINDAIRRTLDREGIEGAHIFAVSSLAPGDLKDPAREGVDVHPRVMPKTPATLNTILWEVRRRADPKSVEDEPPPGTDSTAVPAPPPQDRHILVTGAGFEFQPERCLGSDLVAVGLPTTSQLLAELAGPFVQRGPKDKSDPPRKGFHVVLECEDGKLPGARPKHGDKSLGPRPGAGFGPGKMQNLDDWWNAVLSWAALSHDAGKPLTNREIFERERSLRAAFRGAFLVYDFGQIRHALSAVQLKWAAWLTTNYTGFVDRAIASHADAVSRARSRGGADKAKGVTKHSSVDEAAGWRIVDTSAEAAHLLREIQRFSIEKAQPLFKLHGDISHLRTMAIAGDDKEPYRAFSVIVDDLHLVYFSATSFLSSVLRREPTPVVWHVVGHGLGDAALTKLIDRVRDALPEVEMKFVIVQPTARLAEKVARVLWKSLSRTDKSTAYACAMTAERYLLHLHKDGQPSAWERFSQPLPDYKAPDTRTKSRRARTATSTKRRGSAGPAIRRRR